METFEWSHQMRNHATADVIASKFLAGWDRRKGSRGFPIDKSSTDRGYGKGQRMKTHIPNANTIERTRRLDGGDAMLDLIYQAAKAVHDVEARVASANETERYTRSIAETAVKTLQDAVKRIQELEAQLENSRAKPPSRLHIRTPEVGVRPTMMTLVARARQKITAIAACFQPSVSLTARILAFRTRASLTLDGLKSSPERMRRLMTRAHAPTIGLCITKII